VHAHGKAGAGMSASFVRRPKALKPEPRSEAGAPAFKNYISPAGFKRLTDELAHLWKVERPAMVTTVAWAAANGDRSENGDYLYGKRRLREIDRRVRRISKGLDSAVVVDNTGKRHDRVFFGATVTFQPAGGDEREVTIVGLDELDAGSERISWQSPMAKALLKAMSDYMAAQKSISITYDNAFEVVTSDKQKIQVAASGEVQLMRPDKLRATRHGGFADVEMILDGKTFTVFGKDANVYLQAPMSGTIDQDIDEIREKLHRAIPGADLLSSNVYATLMDGVTDIKDLGSGVIGGKECDHLAFRSEEIDWQIWIAQGPEPHPCRYVITTRTIEGQPQYTLTVTGFKAGEGAVAANAFAFTPPAGAARIEAGDAKGAAALSDMPANFTMGQ